MPLSPHLFLVIPRSAVGVFVAFSPFSLRVYGPLLEMSLRPFPCSSEESPVPDGEMEAGQWMI